MSKRNYPTIRERLALALQAELLREDGVWPGVKRKVRDALNGGPCSKADIYQLCDAMAAAALACERVRISAVRDKK